MKLTEGMIKTQFKQYFLFTNNSRKNLLELEMRKVNQHSSVEITDYTLVKLTD